MNHPSHHRYICIFLIIIGLTGICGAKEPLIGLFKNVALESGGINRNYRMVVPFNYKPERPIGVIFGYHGAGPFSALTQLRDLGVEDLADEAYLITISLAAIPGKGWDQNENLPENLEVILVKDVLRLLRSRYEIDDNRIYALGVSGGSSVVRLLAYALPEEIAAVVGVMAGNKVLLEPHPDSTHAAMFVGGIRDQVFTRKGLEGIASQFPDLYKWDEAFYDKMEPIGVRYFMEEIIEGYRGSGNELHAYLLKNGHGFPQDDVSTTPNTPYLHKAVRFLNTHPKDFQTRLYPAPYTGKPFVDEFKGGPAFPAYPRWRTFSVDAGGRFSNIQGCRLYIYGGKLYSTFTPVKKLPPQTGPGACFMFTDFFARPFVWRTSFTLEKPGKETVVYLCVFRDMQGRVIYLGITRSGWEWGWAESHVDFHTGYAEGNHIITRGRVRLRTGAEYRVVVEYKSDTPHWILYQGRGVVIERTLPEGVPFLDEVEIGLGVKSLPDQQVSFEEAAVLKNIR